MQRGKTTADPLARYVTRFSSDWELETPDAWREFEGTLVYVDISGFTALSEKLARRGRIGAEELTEVLNVVFTKMLTLAYARRGSLLKFGGDALLLLFTGDDHPIQACSAAVEMQDALREAAHHRSSAGRLRLKMSVGIHSGMVNLFRAGDSHHELIITGPAASMTTKMEETAVAGEVLISSATRDAIPAGSAQQSKGEGWLLPWRKARIAAPGFIARSETDPTSIAEATPVGLRDFLRDGGGEPEHHIATVGFIKYLGTDRITRDEGPAATAAALHELVSTVQHVVDDEGVTFLASDIDEDGGKIIIVAGVPGVQDDDSGRVLRAARRIVDDMAPAQLDVKIGVNQGHVFVGDIGTEFRSTYTIMGDTVNLSARLMAASPTGSVYSSAGALDGSHTVFRTTELEPFHVKGKEHPVQAYEIGAPTGSRPREHGGELPFTGRVEELAQLRTIVDRLQSGTGSTLAITGERGSGKSRLIDELRPYLDGVLHIEIRAEPYGTSTPYRPLRDPIREMFGVERARPDQMAEVLRARVAELFPAALPLLPLLGDATMIPIPSTPEVDMIEPQFRQARTADVLTELLSLAFDGPVLFEVEDSHYMDEASTHVMRRVSQATADHPWLVLATRPPGTEGFHLDQEEMRLEPLSDDEARTLVHIATEATPLRPHDVDAIIARSAGLPLFLLELLRALRNSDGVESLPDSLEALVSAQIDALAPLTRRVLRYASVLGHSCRIEAFNELVAPENIVLDAATRKSLRAFVEADGPGRVRFRQAMVRDVSYAGLSFSRRRQLHLRAAESLEQSAAPHEDTVADLLSLHFSLANEQVRTWRYARVAGDQAAAAYANVDAAVHYRRALEAGRRLPNVDDGERATVWTALGDVCERAGLFDEALDAYRRASHLVLDDELRQVDLYLKRALVRRRSGAYRTALSELTKGMHIVEGGRSDGERRARGRLATERSAIRRWQQRPAEALRHAEAAELDAREVNDLPTLGKTLDLIHWAHLMTGDSDHAPPYEETLEIYESLGDLSSVAEVWNNRGAGAFYAGRWEESIDAYARCSAADQQAGNDVGAAIASANVSEILINQRRFDEAEPMLTTALRVLRASGHAPAVAFAESELARLWLRRGELDRATTLLLDIRERSVAAGEALTVLNADLLLAEAKLTAGDATEAGKLLDAATAEGGELLEFFAPAIGRLNALVAAERGSIDEALEHVEVALDQAKGQGLLYEQMLLLLAKADIAQRAGRDVNADDENEASQLIDELGIRREPAAVS